MLLGISLSAIAVFADLPDKIKIADKAADAAVAAIRDADEL